MENCGLSFLLKVGLALCIGMILHQSVVAQSSGDLSTHTYDTVLSSNGFGTYTVSVPQWSPDSGTLVSVKISAAVTSQYGFTLKNADNNPANFSLTLGQEDQITGSALSAPYVNSMSKAINSYSLIPGQTVSQDPFTFLDNHVSSDSITDNISPFLGNGQVSLNYMSFTYTNLSTVNNATYFYSANINNSMHFTVKYTYTSSGSVVLATTLTRFSAALTAPHTAQLSWAAVNETAGRTYNIQRSTDGHNFLNIAFMPAQGNETGADYNYTDQIPDSITGNVYYRLQIVDQSKTSYSSVQQVTVGGSTTPAVQALSVFPNPASSYINVATGTDADDWQFEIVSASGNVVQRGIASQVSTIYITLNSSLSSGTYFIKLLGVHHQKSLTTSFVVVKGN